MTQEIPHDHMQSGSAQDDEDEDETWALEMEEELLFSVGKAHKDAKSSITGTGSTSAVPAATALVKSQDSKSSERQQRSPAADLPQEVLIKILSYTQVGRVSKAWSLAMSTLARRKFSSRLEEILQPLTPKAREISTEVEGELYKVHGHCYTVPKAYGHKARQLLFNLRDSRNGHPRDRLLSGDLTPHAVVRMSVSDMANPQLVRQRKEWIKKRTYEVMRGTQEMDGFTESDMFECRSCGSSRTRYRQWRRKAIVDRTRIIIICLRCPYRWEL